ncbi:MAG: hypothetical protein HWE14_09045 [Flavobacteriia bacterium]|nr:hypothetical protein [Flavobacteriia bacterium]
MRHIAVLLALILGLSGTLRAQNESDVAFNAALDDIYKLSFSSAQVHIREMTSENAEDWRIPYLKFQISFLKHFVDEDEAAFNDDRNHMEDLIELVEDNGDKESPDFHLYLGEMNFQMAAIEAKFNHMWSAAGYGLDGISHLEDGQEEHPTYKPMFAGIGMLNVALGSIPDSYKSFATFLGYSGDMERGMRYLDRAIEASKSSEYEHLRAKHVFVYAYVKNALQPGEIKTLKDFQVDPSQNALLAFLEVKLLQSQGKNSEIIDVIEGVQALPNRYDFPYLDYLLGRAKLARGDDDANLILERYVRKNKGNNYLKSTYRYLNWYYRLKGANSLAESYRHKVLEEGSDFVGADKQALREMEAGDYDLKLIRARLAYDAGELTKALEYVPSGDVVRYDYAELIEFYYRRGRVFQDLNQLSMAVQSFQKAAAIQSTPLTFERVNAELQLAYILEDINANAAIRHYQNVLEFKDYPWYEGTQQKAKAGLSRLGAD